MSEESSKTELITIVCEAILEPVITKHLAEMNVSGYTVFDVRGKGRHGSRSGDWSENANIQIQTICSARLAEEIEANFQERYFKDYAMIMYRTPAAVLRSEKFT